MYVHWHGVQVVPGIQSMTASGAQFEDGQTDDFDVVILATGYRSNVPKWLKVSIYLILHHSFPSFPSLKSLG